METISYPKIVKARKAHVCNYCGFVINKGEKYQTSTYFNDMIYTWKAHIECQSIASKLDMFDDADDGVTGELFYEIIIEEFKEIWIKLDRELYDSKYFVIPKFKEQLEFVIKHHETQNKKNRLQPERI